MVNTNGGWGDRGRNPFAFSYSGGLERRGIDEIVGRVQPGRCPRCEGPLPDPGEAPAGSRVTRCRSIPICERCGVDELYEQLEPGRRLSNPSTWPVPIEDIEERQRRLESPASMRPVISADALLALLMGDGGATDACAPSR
jgi:hypothetical protein